MKKIIQIIITILLTISAVAGIILILNEQTNQKQVYAASNSSTSDVQLMARAINGEARGEPYEGQVAVRSRYFKPSQKL